MTVPSGNGECRGPESAGMTTGSLPSRPARAAANNAANFKDYPADPADQAGFGREDFKGDTSYMGTESIRPSDVVAPVPDLRSMGQSGETFGGGQ